MHNTLEFCPRPARKETNVPLNKRSKALTYCSNTYTVMHDFFFFQGSLVILRTQKTVQAGTTVEKVYQLVIAVPQVWLGTKEIVPANGLIKFYPVKNKKKLEPLYSHVLPPKIGEEGFILSMLILKIADSIFFVLRVRLGNMGVPWGQFSKSIRMELMGFAMILKMCLNVSTIMGI